MTRLPLSGMPELDEPRRERAVALAREWLDAVSGGVTKSLPADADLGVMVAHLAEHIGRGQVVIDELLTFMEAER